MIFIFFYASFLLLSAKQEICDSVFEKEVNARSLRTAKSTLYPLLPPDQFVLSTNLFFEINVSLPLVIGELLQKTADVSSVTKGCETLIMKNKFVERTDCSGCNIVTLDVREMPALTITVPAFFAHIRSCFPLCTYRYV